MAQKHKLQGILSLSAASIALSQSISVKGQQLDQSPVGSGEALNTQNIPKARNLILAPAHHEELVRLYADHASHASHSSHASHASHYSGADDSVPVTPAPPSPSYTNYNQPQPKPRPQPVVPVPRTNSASQTVVLTNSTNQTKALNATNTVTEVTNTNDTELVDFLKKRAAEGSADAQYSLAIRYLYGRDGVKKDVETAKLLLEMSAGKGNKEAKEKLEELKETTQDSEKSGK
jgi:TPR repeat protein